MKITQNAKTKAFKNNNKVKMIYSTLSKNTLKTSEKNKKKQDTKIIGKHPSKSVNK